MIVPIPSPGDVVGSQQLGPNTGHTHAYFQHPVQPEETPEKRQLNINRYVVCVCIYAAYTHTNNVSVLCLSVSFLEFLPVGQDAGKYLLVHKNRASFYTSDAVQLRNQENQTTEGNTDHSHEKSPTSIKLSSPIIPLLKESIPAVQLYGHMEKARRRRSRMEGAKGKEEYLYSAFYICLLYTSPSPRDS